MPVADFTLSIEPAPDTPEISHAVQLIVYDKVAHLRAAATRYDNITESERRRKRGTHSSTLGICHRFQVYDRDGLLKPECAIVRLARPDIGVGVTSHECAHAAIEIVLREAGGPFALDDGNDERFCWVLGELVRQAINGMNERDVYD